MQHSALAHAVRVALLIGMSKEQSASLKYLSANSDVSDPLLASVLDCLMVAGIVAKHDVPEPAYSLARPLDRVTLLDLVEATEGRIQYTNAPSFLDSELVDMLRGAVGEINTGVRTRLAAISLASLTQ